MRGPLRAFRWGGDKNAYWSFELVIISTEEVGGKVLLLIRPPVLKMPNSNDQQNALRPDWSQKRKIPAPLAVPHHSPDVFLKKIVESMT